MSMKNRWLTYPASMLVQLVLSSACLAQVANTTIAGKVVHDFTVLNQGSQIRVEVLTPLDSSTATIGDTIKCRIIDYINVIGQQVACPTDIVTGKIVSIYRPVKTIKSYVPGRNFLNSDARMTLSFDTITSVNGIQTTIAAQPAPNSHVTKYIPSKVDIVANKLGQLETKYNTKKLWAAEAAITAASWAAGPAGLVVAPALTGAAAAVSSTYAAGRPLDKTESQNKTRDLALGVGKGLPGGMVISGATTRGAHLFLEKGDQMLLVLNQDVYFYRGAIR